MLGSAEMVGRQHALNGGSLRHRSQNPNLCASQVMQNASPPQIGRVSTHAQSIRSATVHLTALNRRVAPTPMIDPLMTWVVLSGTPMLVALSMITAAVVCAKKP